MNGHPGSVEPDRRLRRKERPEPAGIEDAGAVWKEAGAAV